MAKRRLMLLGSVAFLMGLTACSGDVSGSSATAVPSDTGISADRPGGPGGSGGGPGGGSAPGGNPGGQTDSSITYSGSTTIDEDTSLDGGSYSSETADEAAILATGGITASIKNATVTKTGDSDGGDATSFYGYNSAILAKGGASLSLEGLTVSSSAKGGNGIFSYGGSATTSNSSSDGTAITVTDSVVTTSKDNSGGIMVTGGGILNAYDLTVTTSGISSAPIRSDRGGGTLNVEGGAYTSKGPGSPAVYSTADITVKGASLISESAEGIVVEGANSVSISNVTLADSNTVLNGQSTTYKNIFLYQSQSGDASSGDGSFSAVSSTISTAKGDTFYVTNNSASIYLEGNEIANSDTDGYFLRAQADSWGSSGSNGGDTTLILKNQEASGDIAIDSISSLEMSLKSESAFSGAINEANEGDVSLSLDSSSTWTLTDDSYLTVLENADSTNSNIVKNGHSLYVNGVSI